MALIIHHLQCSQSERIPWLCEELGIPYNLRLYKRSPLQAPIEYKELHPQGTAPIIQDGDLTLAESGACIEYISHKYAQGKLFLLPEHDAYPDFLYWWHWSNTSLQNNLMMARMGGDPAIAVVIEERSRRYLQMLEERLHDHEWLAGREFTVADIMLVFSLTTFRHGAPFSLAGYPAILAYLQRIGQRKAYQKAMSVSDPDMELALGPEPPVKRSM